MVGWRVKLADIFAVNLVKPQLVVVNGDLGNAHGGGHGKVETEPAVVLLVVDLDLGHGTLCWNTALLQVGWDAFGLARQEDALCDGHKGEASCEGWLANTDRQRD